MLSGMNDAPSAMPMGAPMPEAPAAKPDMAAMKEMLMQMLAMLGDENGPPTDAAPDTASRVPADAPPVQMGKVDAPSDEDDALTSAMMKMKGKPSPFGK